MSLIEYIEEHSPVYVKTLREEFEDVSKELMKLVNSGKIFVAPVEGELIVWFQNSNNSRKEGE